MKKIYLCGVQHFDLKGPDRLKNILKKISPEIIALEFDKKSVEELMRDHRKYYKMIKNKKFNFEAIGKRINKKTTKKFFLSVGYEVWVSEKYAKKNGINIVYLEDDKLIDRVMKNSLHNQTEEDFTKALELNQYKFQKKFDSHYNEVESKKLDNNDEFRLIERNKIFAEKLKKLNGRILVLCGVSHIHGPEPNLKSLLKIYKPEIISLLN